MRMKIGIRAVLAASALMMAQQVPCQDGHAEHGRPAYHVDEVGLGLAPVFDADGHAEPGTALHAHYVHHLGSTQWGIGADVEHIFSDHENSSISAMLQWSPHPYTHLVVAPGLFHPDGTADWNPSLHVEAFQDFHWHGMAIGPFVEWAFETGAQQYEMGFHLGVPIGHADPRYPEHNHHLIHHGQRRESRH